MKSSRTTLAFRSSDRRYGLDIPPGIYSRILELCVVSGTSETGGILIGRYSADRDVATVTEVTGPPQDSIRGGCHFTRGVRGLQSLLNRLWHRKQYYLGEWHYHPFAASIPSSTDHEQMKSFAANSSMKCPEPVLLLIGGDPNKDWHEAAFVFPKGRDAIMMPEVNGKPQQIDTRG